MTTLRMWWVDLDWIPVAHQTALSLTSSAGEGEENKMEILVCQD